MFWFILYRKNELAWHNHDQKSKKYSLRLIILAQTQSNDSSLSCVLFVKSKNS